MLLKNVSESIVKNDKYIKQLEEANEKLSNKLEEAREEIDCLKNLSHKVYKRMSGVISSANDLVIWKDSEDYYKGKNTRYLYCRFKYELNKEDPENSPDKDELSSDLTDLMYCWDPHYNLKLRCIIEDE
jgi:hypothetical protein